MQVSINCFNLIPLPSIILTIEFTYYIVLTALDSFTYLFHRFISPFWDNWQFAQFAQMLTGFGLSIWDLSRIWSADVPRVQIRASPIIQIIWKHHVQGFDFSCYWSFHPYHQLQTLFDTELSDHYILLFRFKYLYTHATRLMISVTSELILFYSICHVIIL